MKSTLSVRMLLCIVLLMSFACLTAQEYTPNQILFKTTDDLVVQRGRTGLSTFDTYLNSLNASNVSSVKGVSGSKWFKADITTQPDWNAIRSNSLRFEGVQIIQPNYLNKMHVVPNDPMYSLQQHNLVDLPAAWNYSVGSPLVLVGVIDSGLLLDHPDLQSNIFSNSLETDGNGIDDDRNGYTDDICGWDFADAPELNDIGLGDYTGQDNDVTDENFHGTHVAGIIGASSNNGIGVAGVCWNVKILPIRAGFRTSSGTGYLQDDDAAAAVIYAADMGCAVVNMSWGDINYSPIIADACQYAYEKGVVLVASAGNDPGPYLSYPAKLSCVISVGAVDPYKKLAGFSSYGPELDLVAPGQQIYSTYKTTEPDLYKEQSGTSMSSPFVAGGAALLKSILPNLTPDEVRARLLTATDDLGEIGFDTFFGHGLMNVRKLLENLNPPEVSITYPYDHIGLSGDFDITGTIHSNDFFRYSVMFSYEDNPTMLDWYDVQWPHGNEPNYYMTQVTDGLLAHFNVLDLQEEGQYLIRIQVENSLGDKYNYFKTVLFDTSAPDLKDNTFGVIQRYDGQNVRFYAGALFDEPVSTELRIYTSTGDSLSCFAAKINEVQVWTLPNTIPSGNISARIFATNKCNLRYQSALMNNIADIQYEIVPTHGFSAAEISSPQVPMNRFFDYDANGKNEFISMNLPSSGYGVVKIYEPMSGALFQKFSFNSAFWPLDCGDTNNSGQELLSTNLETASVYETYPDSLYHFNLIWSETGISGGIFANFNNDSFQDLILVKNLPSERVLQLYKRTGAPYGGTSPMFYAANTLRNKTETNLRNMFVPSLICDNLDGDNIPDILSADTDGDIMIYEVQSNTVADTTWCGKIPVGNAYYLTAGDYDGNGTKDFFVGGYNKDQIDPSQTYWWFEGFTSSANDSYHSMGNIQFNNVVSQNAIQSLDVDNDDKDEIILAISPNLYVLKYINGQFKPVFYGNSMRTYQIAAWSDETDNPHFITNQDNAADSLKAVEWTAQTPFTGPQTPANLTVQPLNEHTVRLSWQTTHADFYRLYRKDLSNTPIAEVSDCFYLDETLVADSTYEYAIAAVNHAYTPNESYLSMWIPVTPMPQPHIVSITMVGANELRIVFDQLMGTSALNPGSYVVNQNVGNPLSANSILNQRGIQLRFRNVFSDTGLSYILTMNNVTGISGVAPAQNQYTFTYVADCIAPEIEQTVIMSDNRTVRITMSESIHPSATSIDNYELVLTANDANNSIVAVDLDDNVLSFTLAHKLKYSNQPYYLILNNVTDLAGNAILLHHNTARFILADIKHLDKVVVFPNPVKSSEQDGVIFMNFPTDKKGKLTIFNTAGDLVYHTNIGPFNAISNNITCRWELTNQTGKKVSSGIYYYLIEMGKDKARGKVAVLN